MIRNDLQFRLMSAYQQWKSSFNPQDLDLMKCGPPLMLSVTEEYLTRTKAVIYGQETFGDKWNDQLTTEYPLYPNVWPFGNLNNLHDFLHHEESIPALCWGYEQFYFAKYQSINRRAPLWSAFHEIVAKLPKYGFLNSNLARFDYDNGSDRQLVNADEVVQAAIVRESEPIFINELTVLNPDACIFLTGPRCVYDSLILDHAFPGLQRVEVLPGVPVRELAKLVHSELPDHAYRTYHPNALRRQNKWHYLDAICSRLL